jgi:hypothetical protein
MLTTVEFTDDMIDSACILNGIYPITRTIVFGEDCTLKAGTRSIEVPSHVEEIVFADAVFIGEIAKKMVRIPNIKISLRLNKSIHQKMLVSKVKMLISLEIIEKNLGRNMTFIDSLGRSIVPDANAEHFMTRNLKEMKAFIKPDRLVRMVSYVINQTKDAGFD